MATRTDIHCPSKLQPQDYEFVTVLDIRPDDDPLAAVLMQAECHQVFQRFLQATGAKVSQHTHGGTCHICGTNAVYMVAWHHVPSNEVILIGYDCTEKLFDGYGKELADINGRVVALRKTAAQCRQNLAGKAKCQALLADEGLSRAWHLSTEAANDVNVWKDKNMLRVDALRTICDIVRTIVRKGYLSDRQANYLRKLVEQHDNSEAVQAARDAAEAAKADCPRGRDVVVGTVLSIKATYTAFGMVDNMLVESDTGFRVFGTLPKSLATALEHTIYWDGAGTAKFLEEKPRVQFTATITPSDTDPKFGFYTRPAKSTILD
jgi:hypothetical protein